MISEIFNMLDGGRVLAVSSILSLCRAPCRHTQARSSSQSIPTSCSPSTPQIRSASTPTRRSGRCRHTYSPSLTTVTSTCSVTTRTSAASSGVWEWNTQHHLEPNTVMFQPKWQCACACVLQWRVRSWKDGEHKADSAVPRRHQWSTLVDRAAGPGGHAHSGRSDIRETNVRFNCSWAFQSGQKILTN